MSDEFWKRKSLAQMSKAEWESLCDGCALCCLHKLEDEGTGDVYFTDIACRLLDLDTCRCMNYRARVKIVSSCLMLSADKPEAFRWLPGSCAYRLLAEGRELPAWHPLVSGDPDAVHKAGISARSKAVSENETSQWSVVRNLSDHEG
jgi:uncharacterized cysteine cluster protein YcgN (CxxCxxCC family)